MSVAQRYQEFVRRDRWSPRKGPPDDKTPWHVEFWFMRFYFVSIFCPYSLFAIYHLHLEEFPGHNRFGRGRVSAQVSINSNHTRSIHQTIHSLFNLPDVPK